jgi:hypothetical protein
METKLLPKVKNLVWRVCRDCFPPRVRINNIGVACSYECVICSDADEDSLHALFTYPRASQVRQAANLRNVVENVVNEFDNTTSVVFCLLDRLQLP